MSSDPNGSTTEAVVFHLRKLESVQDILDRNKLLLHQIKVNHESQKPEGLAKNFVMIREVNLNIEKVLNMYTSISDDFVAFMQQQRPGSASGGQQHGSDDADQRPRAGA